MRIRRHRRRQWFVAFAVLLLMTLGLVLPSLMGVFDREIAFKGMAVMAASGDTFSVTAPVRLFETPRLVLERGAISVAAAHRAAPRSTEAMAALLTSGNARLVLHDASLTLKAGVPASQHSPHADDPVDTLAPLLKALVDSSFESLSLRDSTLRFVRADGSAQLLTDVSADITVRRANAPVQVVGKFKLRGEPIVFEASMGPRPAKTVDASLPVTAKLKSSFFNATIDGRLVFAETLHLAAPAAAIEVSDIRKAAHWLGHQWPTGSGPQKFQAKGHLDWSDRSLEFQQSTLSIDDNEATGALTVTLGESRPVIDGTLALRRLDLTRYPVKTPPADAKGWLENMLRGLIGAPGDFSLPLIRYFDADLRISADQVTVAGLQFERSAAAVALKGGKLTADVAEIEIGQGSTGSGRVSVDMSGSEPRYGLRAKLGLFGAERATSLLFGYPAVHGRADIMLDVNAVGDTADRLLATVTGKVGLSLPEGGRLGCDTSSLTEAASAKLDAGWGAAGRGRTWVDDLEARFLVSGGVLTAETLRATAGSTEIRAWGSISVPTRTLDLRLTTAERPAVSGGAARKAPDVIQMHGPWSGPSIRFQTDQNKASATPAVNPPPQVVVQERHPG